LSCACRRSGTSPRDASGAVAPDAVQRGADDTIAITTRRTGGHRCILAVQKRLKLALGLLRLSTGGSSMAMPPRSWFACRTSIPTAANRSLLSAASRALGAADRRCWIAGRARGEERDHRRLETCSAVDELLQFGRRAACRSSLGFCDRPRLARRMEPPLFQLLHGNNIRNQRKAGALAVSGLGEALVFADGVRGRFRAGVGQRHPDAG